MLTWTGNLAVGATATITYTVTAHSGTGTATRPWSTRSPRPPSASTCPPATGNPACRTTVAVLTPALTITASASQATAVPGDTVTYTVVATNTGQTPYAAAAFSAPLAGVLRRRHLQRQRHRQRGIGVGRPDRS